MKKLVGCFCFVICLCLSLPCLAADFHADFFTLSYDETSFQTDTTTYAYENTADSYHWYGMIYNNDYLIDIETFDYEDLEGVTLFTLDSLQRQKYVDFMLDAFSDSSIAYIRTRDVSQYQIPFYFFSCEDADGTYLFAETVVKGKAIRLSSYYHNASREVDMALLDALTEMLDTFQPVV